MQLPLRMAYETKPCILTEIVRIGSQCSLLALAGVFVFLTGHLAIADDQSRLPIPEDSDLQRSLKLVKDVYGQRWTEAKSDKEKRAYAVLLFSKSEESDDAANRYALLRVARDIATQASDGLTAFRAIDEMDRVFRVDAIGMKADVLTALGRKARTSAEHRSIAIQAMSLITLASSQDNFELAEQMGELALSASRKTRDAELIKIVTAQNRQVEQTGKLFELAKSALTVLQKSPTDPAANLEVGRYRSFCQGDWETGLPMLALGSDTQLKDLAVKELQGKFDDPSVLVELGDGWWEIASRSNDASKQHILEHAEDLYTQALPRLSGLTRDKARLRLEEILTASDAARLKLRQDEWKSLDVARAVDFGSFMRIHSEEGEPENPNGISTKASISGPVEIRLVVRTDSTNIRLNAYNQFFACWNWQGDPDQVRVRIPGTTPVVITTIPRLPANQWHRLRCVITPALIEVFNNGQQVVKLEGRFDLSRSAPIKVFSAFGSTIDVRSFVVKPL